MSFPYFTFDASTIIDFRFLIEFRPKKDLEAIAEATPNVMATNAIVGKLNEVSKEAEALDIALRDTQNCLEMGGNCSSNSNSLDRKTDGNVSIDSRDTIEVNETQSFYFSIFSH